MIPPIGIISFSVHVAMQDSNNFYALAMFSIIDDIILEFTDGKKAYAIELCSPGLIQGTYGRHGRQDVEGLFGSLESTLSSFWIIPSDIEPDVDEISFCFGRYQNVCHLGAVTK